MSTTTRIEDQVLTLADPVASELGLEIVLVQFLREAGGTICRILIDKPGGITVEDCRNMSRELADILDVEDPIPSKYRLEVSSPGLDRPLVKESDYEKYAGLKITLRAEQAIEGRRKFTGVLKRLDGQKVMMEVEGSEVEIPLSNIKKANLVPELDGFPAKSDV